MWSTINPSWNLWKILLTTFLHCEKCPSPSSVTRSYLSIYKGICSLTLQYFFLYVLPWSFQAVTASLFFFLRKYHQNNLCNSNSLEFWKQQCQDWYFYCQSNKGGQVSIERAGCGWCRSRAGRSLAAGAPWAGLETHNPELEAQIIPRAAGGLEMAVNQPGRFTSFRCICTCFTLVAFHNFPLFCSLYFKQDNRASF